MTPTRNNISRLWPQTPSAQLKRALQLANWRERPRAQVAKLKGGR